eukprot:3643329-Pleurochrysis_carterae.AAC.1
MLYTISRKYAMQLRVGTGFCPLSFLNAEVRATGRVADTCGSWYRTLPAVLCGTRGINVQMRFTQRKRLAQTARHMIVHTVLFTFKWGKYHQQYASFV